ncbi:MAG: DUF739 family protein [Methanobrevibacter sp.]|nr:DUF739 family protein [Methanobrevibacter sp.]
MATETVFDTSKLRGRIVEKFGTIDAFSSNTSLTRASVSDYLNGKKTLNQKDMNEWMELLGIEESDIFDYFFAKKVDKREQIAE